MVNHEREYLNKGWTQFGTDTRLLNWVHQICPFANRVLHAPENKEWFRYGNTWFAGVNVLPNRTDGSVESTDALQCDATEFIQQIGLQSTIELDNGQLSVCYPGYPKPSPTESEAANRYRRNRDAAHLDGLLPVGDKRRRYLKEMHAYILGIPMNLFPEHAAPFVLWEGSHHLIRDSLRQLFGDTDPENWGSQDITDFYQSLRRRIFDNCSRVEVHAKPGEAFVVHRMMLHGVAPWENIESESGAMRMICYFRPAVTNPRNWLYGA
ncbi:MAG: hypothetical protein AAF402_03965 [Pseudomonadota bacterium]